MLFADGTAVMVVVNIVGNLLHSHEMTTTGGRYMYRKSSREYIHNKILHLENLKFTFN